MRHQFSCIARFGSGAWRCPECRGRPVHLLSWIGLETNLCRNAQPSSTIQHVQLRAAICQIIFARHRSGLCDRLPKAESKYAFEIDDYVFIEKTLLGILCTTAKSYGKETSLSPRGDCKILLEIKCHADIPDIISPWRPRHRWREILDPLHRSNNVEVFSLISEPGIRASITYSMSGYLSAKHFTPPSLSNSSRLQQNGPDCPDAAVHLRILPATQSR